MLMFGNSAVANQLRNELDRPRRWNSFDVRCEIPARSDRRARVFDDWHLLVGVELRLRRFPGNVLDSRDSRVPCRPRM
jgi:hypothetical protein